MIVAKPINVIRILTKPFVKFLSGTCNLLAKITGINKVLNNDKISKEEIISVVDTGVVDGVLDEEKQKMILSVLKFSNLTAKDIMTPRINVYMLNIDCCLKDEIDEIFENKYSRIPVYQDNKDNIIGIINIKDLTEAIIKKGIENLKLTSCSNEGNIAKGKYSGGIVGYSQESTISACTNIGDVNGSTLAGGVVGFLKSGYMTGCSSSAETVKTTTASSPLPSKQTSLTTILLVDSFLGLIVHVES